MIKRAGEQFKELMEKLKKNDNVDEGGDVAEKWELIEVAAEEDEGLGRISTFEMCQKVD